jgi:hypothetical protein
VGDAREAVLGMEDGATDGALLCKIVGKALGSMIEIEDETTDGRIVGGVLK